LKQSPRGGKKKEEVREMEGEWRRGEEKKKQNENEVNFTPSGLRR
jgi:hypothetical protein